MIVKRVDGSYIQSEQFENDDMRIRKDPLTFIELFICTLIMLIILSGFLFYSWRNHEYLKNQYELRALEENLKQLKYENQKLILERKYLSSVERIDEIVTEELNLRPTDLSRIIIVPENENEEKSSIYLAEKRDLLIEQTR